jgi:hypothetical protein
MGDFETIGEFWLPNSPEIRVPGRLTATETGKWDLQLLGSLSPDVALTERPSHPAVHGVLHRSPRPGAGLLSLLDAYAATVSWSSNGTRLESIVANHALVGDEHIESSDTAFSAVAFEISGLTHWADHRVLEVSSRPELLVQGTQPKRTSAGIEGTTITITTSYSANMEAGSIRCSERTDVLVQPSGALPERDFRQRYVVPMRNLVSLALNRHCPVTSRTSYLNDDPEGPVVHDLEPDRTPKTTRGVEANWRDALFKAPSTDESLASMLARWLPFSRNHRRALGLCFGLMESPPRLAEMRFSLTVDAAELLAGRLTGDPRVQALASAVDASAQALVGNVSSFCDSVSTLRATLWDEERPLGLRLHFVTEALMWLIKLRLATEAGVDPVVLAKARPFLSAAEHIRVKLEAGS